MERILTTARPDWQARVEALGFDFHSDPVPYWRESAAYQLSQTEVDQLQTISEELHQMFLETVDLVIRGKVYSRFNMPSVFIEALERSWHDRQLTLYGRFDYGLDQSDGRFKLLEYNADTPEILLETAKIQRHWQIECFPEQDQFNQIEAALVKAWQRIRSLPNSPEKIHCMTLTQYKESKANTLYMASLAEKAGFRTELISAHDFLWDHDASSFSREDGRSIKGLFKIYPWEWMFASGQGLTKAGVGFQVYEPPWKYLLSNKAILALLWKRYPHHPNLLPTYFIPEAFQGPLIKKACTSRNSEDVFYCQDPHTTQDYGQASDRFIYQAVCKIQDYNGHFPILGVFMVEDKAQGLGIREDQTLINTDKNLFVPHLIST